MVESVRMEWATDLCQVIGNGGGGGKGGCHEVVVKDSGVKGCLCNENCG